MEQQTTIEITKDDDKYKLNKLCAVTRDNLKIVTKEHSIYIECVIDDNTFYFEINDSLMSPEKIKEIELSVEEYVGGGYSYSTQHALSSKISKNFIIQLEFLRDVMGTRYIVNLSHRERDIRHLKNGFSDITTFFNIENTDIYIKIKTRSELTGIEKHYEAHEIFKIKKWNECVGIETGTGWRLLTGTTNYSYFFPSFSDITTIVVRKNNILSDSECKEKSNKYPKFRSYDVDDNTTLWDIIHCPGQNQIKRADICRFGGLLNVKYSIVLTDIFKTEHKSWHSIPDKAIYDLHTADMRMNAVITELMRNIPYKENVEKRKQYNNVKGFAYLLGVILM